MIHIRSRCSWTGRLLATGCFLAGMLLCGRPAAPAPDSAAGAEPKAIFTVEVATFPLDQKESAITTAQSLEKQEFPDVRVELIDGSYSVRVGVYDTRPQGLPVYQKMLKILPKSQLRTASLAPERVIYPKPATAESAAVETTVEPAAAPPPAPADNATAAETTVTPPNEQPAEATAAETAVAAPPAPEATPAPVSEQPSQPIVAAEPARTPAAPPEVSAEVFTIQVASFTRAEKEQAVQTAQGIEQKGFTDVRVESIGAHYTVRVGAFAARDEALPLYRKLRATYPAALLRTGYVIPTRVIYPESPAAQPAAPEAEPAAVGAPAPSTAPVAAPETAATKEPAPEATAAEPAPAAETPAEVLTIQVASCGAREKSRAIDIAQHLETAGFSAVRVELINKLYTVRAGAYATLEEATPWYRKASRMFPGCVVRTAYILPERIVYPAERAAAAPTAETAQEQQPAAAQAAPGKETNDVVVVESSVLRQAAQPAPQATAQTAAPSGELEPDLYPELPLLQRRMPRVSTPALPAKPNRLEFDYSFETLSPHDVYGDWQSAHVIYTRRQSPTFSYLVDLGTYWRSVDGSGSVLGLGAYKTWKPNFFTYSAVSFGTDVNYLSSFRFDTDLGFKFGPNKNYIWQIGGSYVQSNDGVHSDVVLDTGLIAYFSKWIFAYKLNQNTSNPGSVVAYNHTISVDYGTEGVQWLGFAVAFGKGAYLATEGLLFPTEVQQNSLYVSTHIRRWLRPYFGIIGDINYVNLEGSYDKYGATVGVFQEF